VRYSRSVCALFSCAYLEERLTEVVEESRCHAALDEGRVRRAPHQKA